MDIGDWKASAHLNEIYREIRNLGLETNLAELEAFGFTVIENSLPPDMTVRLRDIIIAQAEKVNKTKLDLENETNMVGTNLVSFLIYKDPLFEEALLNPGPLALVTYLLGKHCAISDAVSHLKGPGGEGTFLHADTANGVPPPFPPYPQFANINYVLTDYTEDKGALAIVPGSHRYARQPSKVESQVSGPSRNASAVSINAPAGSAIIFQGMTWHGSFPRQVPGLRVNLSYFFARQYMAPLENYADCVPADVLERHGPGSRMRQLLGLVKFTGYHDEGPDWNKVEELNFGVGKSWHS